MSVRRLTKIRWDRLRSGVPTYVSSRLVRYLRYNTVMALSIKRPYTLKIDPELLDALKAIKERDGISESEQIRRGIRLWLDQKGVKPGRQRKGGAK
jgi:hypothetical protein